MSIAETSLLPVDLAAALDIALENVAAGRSDPEVMRQACDEQDQAREELRRRLGELDIAVELIRETRDEA
jgi:hypothetical protein